MKTVQEDLLNDIAAREDLEPVRLKELVTTGQAVILHNPRHRGLQPCAVGKDLYTKINVNLGISPGNSDLASERQKMQAALRLGADTLMDLSLGDNLDEVRKELIESSPVPVGTVPLYQAIYEKQRRGPATELDIDDILKTIQKQAEDGVDFITVHCGITRQALEYVRKSRILGVVSRGGSIMAAWMYRNGKENPLYEYYDQLLDLAGQYDLTLSLGDGLRPGCIADGTDRAQFQELVVLGDLTARALERGVKVLVEGPGHLMLNQVEMNMLMQKKLCHEVPFYILGPLVTDIAPGYDHITSAIGSAVAAASGADFICCVTPAEHLALPGLEDIVQGTVAGKIAAHAADLVKGKRLAYVRDLEMARARKDLNWEKQFGLALNPDRARHVFRQAGGDGEPGCTMCGDLCAIKTYREGEKQCML